MGYRSDLNHIILSLSPYSLLAYCAIYLVVRGEATKQTCLNDERQSAVEQQFRAAADFIDGGTLVRDLHDNCAENTNCVQHPTTGPVRYDQDSTLRDVKDEEKPALRLELPDDHVESLFNDVVNVLTPVVVKIPDPVCREHVSVFLHQLRRYKMWALQMYDSSAKIPSGILKGNLNQLGDYDQCLSLNVTLDKHGVIVDADADADAVIHIDGKYCLALVDVVADSSANGSDSLAEAVSRAQALGFLTSTLHDPGHFIPQFTSINWAVCLPSSCSAENLQSVLEAVLPQPGLKFMVRVDENMCHVTGKKHVTAMTYVAVFGFGFVIIVAVVATMRESFEKNKTIDRNRHISKIQRIVSSFSLQRNWSSLLSELPVEGDIHCIHGIRAVCTIMLYAAHMVMPLAFTPYTNRILLTELSLEPMSMMLRASLIYTDSFLLLSGVLTAYNLSKEMQRTKKIDWFKRYTARFIRLTPALLALVVFYAYIMEHLGEGPLWNKVIKTNADLCKANLWTNVLYIQNFFPFQDMCATHTHQLALDMQLSLLSPILVYLLYTHQALGVFVLVALHAAIAALRFFVTFRNHLSLIIYHGMPLSQLYKTANLSYSLSSHRATPYLMGVGVGYFLYRNEKSFHIPKLVLYLGWLLAGWCTYMSVFAPAHVAHPSFIYDPLEAAIYAGYSSVTWSLALGWVICACALGHARALNSLLSLKALVFTSRISYSMYLTQFAVFFYNVGSLRSSQELSLLKAVSLEELFVVLLVSIASTLLFDLPMQELKAILTGSGARTRITAKEQ